MPGNIPAVDELHAPVDLPREQIAFYRENGYVKMDGLLDPGLISRFRNDIAAEVAALRREAPPLEARSTYDKAFLQLTNLWRRSPLVRELVFSRRLARVAAELMGSNGVRLWHDQALFKEPGGGVTPWHADQYYWPLSNDRAITAWIPLVEVPLEMGPLGFCPGSHRLQFGRDLAISDESEISLKQQLAAFGCDERPFRLGDASFHSGWTFHRAGANRTGRMREVFTIIYIDKDMRLEQPRNKNQEADREAWCPNVSVGEIIDSLLTPVLYSSHGG
jgi:ectoine hydroxylase-related dioxygenase (phytanoyl-CoA dioxygenase family)